MQVRIFYYICMVHSSTNYMLNFNYNDGGRSAVFNTKGQNDCVTRALAIVTGLPYMEVWAGIHKNCSVGKTGRVVTSLPTFEAYANSLGLVAVPYGCVLKDAAFPAKAIAHISGHMFAVIDNVIQDTYNPSPAGRAWLHAMWVPKPERAALFDVIGATGAKVNRCAMNLEQAVNMARLLLLNYKKQTTIKPHE